MIPNPPLNNAREAARQWLAIEAEAAEDFASIFWRMINAAGNAYSAQVVAEVKRQRAK